MQTAAPPAPKVRYRKLPLAKRARSVPHRRSYVLALIVSATLFLALIGTGAALFAFMVLPSKNAASLLIGFAGFSAILWLFSFFKRRGCHCPLCKGTPFLDSGALRHKKAFRFYPLNYGSSNVIRALIRQHFRCQYCGTPFDLLKPLNGHQVKRKKHHAVSGVRRPIGALPLPSRGWPAEKPSGRGNHPLEEPGRSSLDPSCAFTTRATNDFKVSPWTAMEKTTIT